METFPNLDSLMTAPQTFDAPEGVQRDGVQAMFFEGVPYRGTPTRVFAYYAVPEVEEGQSVPGIVLAHGGGGTAFDHWVRMWKDRGYAAIAIDWAGRRPTAPGEEADPNGRHIPHEYRGPQGQEFDRAGDPPEDQWVHHAVAAIIRAHSFLAAQSGVDPARIGLTGISWGGFLSCVAAGLDHRFRFVAPVYGCGYLGESCAWSEGIEQLGATGQQWLELWDPKNYLSNATMPMLWLTGTSDFAYTLEMFQHSYRTAHGHRTLCVRVDMEHGYEAGSSPPEIEAFADSVVRGGMPLAQITNNGPKSSPAWATFIAPSPIRKAMLNYTADSGRWQNRTWKTIPAEADSMTGRVAANLPPEARVYFFNIIDDRGLMVSTEHVVI